MYSALQTSTIPGGLFTEVTTSRVAPSAFRESKDAAAALIYVWYWSGTENQRHTNKNLAQESES